MASINCPKCGLSNDSRGIFCGNCGYALQADGSATSSPSQPQQGGMYSSSPSAAGSPPPPTYSTSNMPSSPVYPAAGAPPPPSYPANNMPSSSMYLGGGSPPSSPSSPSYPTNVMPSSPAYPTDRSQLAPANQPDVPPTQRRRGKKGIIAILVIVVIVILAGAAGVFEYESHSGKSVATTGTSTATTRTTATAAPTTAPSTPTPDATGTALASGSSTATPGATATTGSSTATPSATATTGPSGSNYSAAQPGPGCDTNGGTWTPQGISNIACGTTISVSSSNARGYLYFQLPNNESFSQNNIIGVAAKVGGSTDCVGLAEQDANTGYLVEYCGNGDWNIYSITSGGATVKALAQSITSTRSSEQLSLTLKGNTLTFTIDTEVHSITVSPIQPVKVAITFVTAYGYGSSVPITNFSYQVQ